MAESTERESGRREHQREDGAAPRDEELPRADAVFQEEAEREGRGEEEAGDRREPAQREQPEGEEEEQPEGEAGEQPEGEEEEQPEGEQEEQPEGEAEDRPEGEQERERGEEDEGDESDDGDGSAERRSAPSISAKEMTLAAMDTLRDLTGHVPEAATGLQWDGDSWLVTVDVLELERVPNTTDLLATYVVQLDDDGGLLGYKRTRRFQRSQAEEE